MRAGGPRARGRGARRSQRHGRPLRCGRRDDGDRRRARRCAGADQCDDLRAGPRADRRARCVLRRRALSRGTDVRGRPRARDPRDPARAAARRTRRARRLGPARSQPVARGRLRRRQRPDRCAGAAARRSGAVLARGCRRAGRPALRCRPGGRGGERAARAPAGRVLRRVVGADDRARRARWRRSSRRCPRRRRRGSASAHRRRRAPTRRRAASSSPASRFSHQGASSGYSTARGDVPTHQHEDRSGRRGGGARAGRARRGKAAARRAAGRGGHDVRRAADVEGPGARGDALRGPARGAQGPSQAQPEGVDGPQGVTVDAVPLHGTAVPSHAVRPRTLGDDHHARRRTRRRRCSGRRRLRRQPDDRRLRGVPERQPVEHRRLAGAGRHVARLHRIARLDDAVAGLRRGRRLRHPVRERAVHAAARADLLRRGRRV